MKKVYYSAIALLVFISCTQVNSNGDKTVTQGDDTVSDVSISLSKMDIVEELAAINEEKTDEVLFKASGSEPGWSAEFYKERIFIAVNYGADTFTVKRHNTDLDQKTNLKIALDAALIDHMEIENKSCTNMAGDKESSSVKLFYKGKLYKGCGSFVK